MTSGQTRVLQIVADGSPGGGTTFVLGLSADLQNSGKWRPSLVTQAGSYAATTAGQMGMQVYGLDFFRSRFDLTLPDKLAEVIAQARPDIIHIHGGRGANPFSFGRLRQLDIPLVYTVHGYHFLNKPAILRQIFAWRETQIAGRVQHVVFVSEHDQQIARRWNLLPAAKCSVIYNGIDPAELDAVAPDQVPRDVLFAARISPQKNPFFLIDIARHLSANVRITVQGGGKDLAKLQEEASKAGVSDRMEFAGEVTRTAVISAMKAARLYILPSLWEGLPIAPIEAGYCGIPVLASDIPGTREVVENGVTGVLVKDFSAPAYAAEIERLLADPDRAVELGANGRQRVLDRFVRSRSSEQYTNLYDTVTNRKGS